VQLPLSSVLSPPETPKLESKLFSADDPALVVLYKQLRAKSLQTLRGALSISPKAEWEFVLHISRLYGRMGCDLLALDLGKCKNLLSRSCRILTLIYSTDMGILHPATQIDRVNNCLSLA
jgi:hypothetical protein